MLDVTSPGAGCPVCEEMKSGEKHFELGGVDKNTNKRAVSPLEGLKLDED